MKIIKKICGIFCVLMAITGICLAFTTTPAMPFIVEFIIFGGLSFLLLRKTPLEREKHKEKKSIRTLFGTHVSGLDIGKAQVSICLSDNGLLISAPSMKKEFSLLLNNIQTLGYYNEVEIEKHLKSSLAGGIIGAATFGVAGAVIGARPKEKQKHKVTSYILIDYTDGQIIIEAYDAISVGKMIDYFRKLKPQANETISVEL